MKKKRSSEVTKKTIRYILVYLVCLILAFLTWLLVMFSRASDNAEKKITVSSESVCAVWEQESLDSALEDGMAVL